MKKYFYYSLCIPFSFLLSCSAESDAIKRQSEWVKVNGTYMRKSDVLAERPTGTPPYGHKIHSFMQPSMTLSKMDEIYRTEFTNKDSLKLDYNTTVKQLAISHMMNSNLSNEGTAEQKRYYINEQLSMPMDLVNIENFYKLLLSDKGLYQEEERNEIATAFYDRNYKAITTAKFTSGADDLMGRLNASYENYKNNTDVK